jgi:hypothetical protein
MAHDEVIRFAREAHGLHWRLTGNAGTGDKLAAAVTSHWQNAVVEAFPGRFIPEHPVGKLGERIDLIDIVDGIAYELKVSPNNDHFEFYRDVFKVLIARQEGLSKVRTFCFVCPSEAASRFEKGLRRSVLALGPHLGLSISVAGI